MEYLVLKTQKENPIPRVSSWFGKLDERKLTLEAYKELPRYFLLDMKTGTDILYPDIMTEPFLMVSKEAADVLRMYEEDIPFLFVVLFDTEKGESVSYHLPILTEGDENCRKAVYRIRNKNRWEIRVRMDLAESLIYRGAEGIAFEKISIEKIP